MRCRVRRGLSAAAALLATGGLTVCQGCLSTSGGGYRYAPPARVAGTGGEPSWDVSAGDSETGFVELASGETGEPLAGTAAAAPDLAAHVARPLASQIGVPDAHGWRMGAVYLDPGSFGARDLKDEHDIGPWLSAWGYQLEYKREGGPGAPTEIVEFVPLLMGLNESLAIITVNFLVGLRYENGLEFALGPHYAGRIGHPWEEGDGEEDREEDKVHVPGLGLAVAAGKTWEVGEMNVSLSLSAMFSGDITAYGLTIGWNQKSE